METINHLWHAGTTSENIPMMHKRFFKHTEKCPRNIEMLARAINASHMESNIPHTKSLALSYFVLQQHRCSVACLGLTKIASIGLSSTGSTPWWIVQHLS
uniref:Uncharacterized protein n=1 Tax=Populus trichocarpa TaxID=3694 RepID=A0A2K1Y4U6_POPTR